MSESETTYPSPCGELGIVVWAWYAVGLHTRMTLGRRNRWAAWFGVIGFAALGGWMVISTLIVGQWHVVGVP